MALLLFGWPYFLRGSWLDLRGRRLLFHLRRCTLRTFAAEAVRELAALIRVNLHVVLGPRNRYIGEAGIGKYPFVFIVMSEGA
jgi:hypothetical protein